MGDSSAYTRGKNDGAVWGGTDTEDKTGHYWEDVTKKKDLFELLYKAKERKQIIVRYH